MEHVFVKWYRMWIPNKDYETDENTGLINKAEEQKLETQLLLRNQKPFRESAERIGLGWFFHGKLRRSGRLDSSGYSRQNRLLISSNQCYRLNSRRSGWRYSSGIKQKGGCELFQKAVQADPGIMIH